MQTQASETRYDKKRRLIAQSVLQLQSEHGFQAWVRTRALFRSYSLRNTLLISLQYPEATRVAGLKTWNKLGRRVRKGEKGIGIVAPIISKRSDANATHVDEAEERESVVGWRLVHVFDVSQTHGEPLPDGPEVTSFESSQLAELRDPLEHLAVTLGYAVTYGDTGSARGVCDIRERTITISNELAADDQVATLIHELAHAQGIDYESFTRPEAEVIVETATAILLLGLGMPIDTRSVPYIAGWSTYTDPAETLERYAKAIDQCARTIEKAIAE